MLGTSEAPQKLGSVHFWTVFGLAVKPHILFSVFCLALGGCFLSIRCRFFCLGSFGSAKRLFDQSLNLFTAFFSQHFIFYFQIVFDGFNVLMSFLAQNFCGITLKNDTVSLFKVIPSDLENSSKTQL